MEQKSKPPQFESRAPIIDRPFEDAHWAAAIEWPFKHWQASRFSDGRFGVWYGSPDAETTVHESAFHWYNGFLRDAGFAAEGVIGERKLYLVDCHASVTDLRPASRHFPLLLDPVDYSLCQQVGARLHFEGHPGLAAFSVRHPDHTNLAIFNPKVLSNTRLSMQVRYVIAGGCIRVQKQPDHDWFRIDPGTFVGP